MFCVSKGVDTMDTFETIKQLNAVLRFVGLSCIYRDGTVLKQSSSLCKILFFIITHTFGNILSLYIKFYMNGGLTSFSFKDAIHFVYLLGYFLYVCDMFYVYKYRHIYLEYITMYDNIDRILGVNNNRLIKSKVTKISLLFVTIDLFSSLFEYFFWVYFYGWFLSTIYSIEFVYYIFKSLSLADMTASLIHFEYRLRVIGDLLENTGKNITLIKPIQQKLTDMPLDNKVYKIDMAATNHDRPETIKLVTKCYLFILDQADSINTMYGFRILLTSVVILKTLVMLLNILIRLFLGSLYTETQELKYFFITSTIIRVIIRNFVAISSTHCIEMSYRQNERIIKIIDRTLIFRNVSPPTARALRGLRQLITSRPLSFHAHNFFRLDYTFLVSIYSATVTYTIILLQNVQ